MYRVVCLMLVAAAPAAAALSRTDLTGAVDDGAH